MAKKKAAAAEETPAAEAPEKPEAAAPAGDDKKGKEKRGKEAKAKPEAPAPVAESAAAAPPAGGETAPKAPAAPPAPGEPTKKKNKQPGKPPPYGKKLKNKLREMQQRLAKEGPLPVKRAVGVLKQMKRVKFDETVEIHMNLGIDTTQNDQMVRGSVRLPHGIGKTVRVLVFTQGDNVARAKEAGADFAGGDDLIKQIQGGWLDFDVALATQDMMGMVSRLGKVLGPRGLMPTPKAGTVITAGSDVTAAVRDFKAGKVEFRADKGGNVHAGVGKLSFEEDKLADNITAFVDQIKAAKPAGVKGHYVRSVMLSATMSPGVPVSV
jgi:large subunit ribosomal protein L1